MILKREELNKVKGGFSILGVIGMYVLSIFLGGVIYGYKNPVLRK